MKFLSLPTSLAALTLAACLISPSSSYADRKVKVWRDLDGDGHFNKKTYSVPSRRHYYGGHHGGRHYSRDYGYRRHYYPRSYDYGYYRPYSYSYGPSFGLSFYSQPSYYTNYTTRSVYRTAPRVSASYEGSLAADVQEALKRRGYYRGAVDGDIGPASRSAIRAYQSERGLSVTGRIDRSLLEALGIG